METWEQRRDGAIPDTIFTLEHDPVITLGKRAKETDVLVSDASLAQRGIDLVRVDRGGEATWHGPGQLVLYPIVHVAVHEIGVSDLVRGLAGAISSYLDGFDIDARWSNEHPGVWVGDRKIAAVGMRVQSGVSRHGAALNLHTATDAYSVIVPCGMPQAGVTSVFAETGAAPSLEEAAAAVVERLAAKFGFEVEPVEAR